LWKAIKLTCAYVLCCNNELKPLIYTKIFINPRFRFHEPMEWTLLTISKLENDSSYRILFLVKSLPTLTNPSNVDCILWPNDPCMRVVFVLEHCCEDGKKLEGWKIKHQVIKLWSNVVWIEKIECGGPT